MENKEQFYIEVDQTIVLLKEAKEKNETILNKMIEIDSKLKNELDKSSNVKKKK